MKLIYNVSRMLCSLIFVLTAGLSCMPISAQLIQWTPLNYSPVVSDLLDVVVLARGDAIAVGRSGAIHVARNGVNFEAVGGRYQLPDFRSVSGGFELEVLAGGDDGVVAFSKDAGESWEHFEIDVGDVYQIADLPGPLSWLLATELGIFIYKPGVPPLSIHVGNTTSVVRSNDSTYYAGFVDGRILKSTDTGKNWIHLNNIASSQAVRKLRSNVNEVIIVRAESIDILHHDDTYIRVPPPTGLNITFTDAAMLNDTLIATGQSIGSSHVYTTNLGDEWYVTTGVVFAGNAMALSTSRFVCVGERGSSATSSIDSVVTVAFRFVGFGFPSAYISPSKYRAFSGNPRSFTIFSVEPHFTIRETKDSGKTYTTVFDRGNGLGLQGWNMMRQMDTLVVLADSFKVVFEGPTARESSRYVIYTTHDGGTTWDTILSPHPDMKLTKMIRAADGRIFVYGGRQVLVSINGGRTFDSLSNLPFTRCEHYSVLGNLHIAGPSTLFRSIDGAESWQPIAFSIVGSVRAVTITHSGRILIALKDSEFGSPILRIAASDDLGQTWNEVTKHTLNHPTQLILSMTADSMGQIVVTTDAPVVYYSLDNGTTWSTSPVPIAATVSIYSGEFTSQRELVLVGSEDAFLRGVVSVASGIERSTPALDVELLSNNDVELLELRIFDVMGKLLSEHQSVSPFLLRKVVDVHSCPMMCFALGKDVNGRAVRFRIFR